MGWSNDQFDGSLTLPTGSTSGQRIVLDGTSTPASITVYDASNNIVAQMTTDIPNFAGDSGGFFTLDPATQKIVGIFGEAIQFGDAINSLVNAPTIFYQYFSIPGPDVTRLQLQSGRVIASQTSARLNLDCSTTGFRPEVSMASAAVDIDDFLCTIYGDLEIKRNLSIDGVDQGRGPVSYTPITSNTGTVTTTETIAIDTPAMTFVTGRAYRITAKGLVQSSISGDVVRVRVRQTGLGGALLYDSHGGLAITANNGNTAFYQGNIVRNDTGSDITDDIVLTYVRQSGTGNALIAATATQPAYLDVEDIGASSSFANATAL